MSADDQTKPADPPPEKPAPRDPTKIQTHGLDPDEGNTIYFAEKLNEKR